MATRGSASSSTASAGTVVSAGVDELLMAAQDRSDSSLETGRYIVTYKENALAEGHRSLRDLGLRVADARDFETQQIEFETLGNTDVLVFPEIGAALVSGPIFTEGRMSLQTEITADSPIEAIEPEYFAFTQHDAREYMRGFLQAAKTIAADLGGTPEEEAEPEEDVTVLGNTWGLIKCKVPSSTRSGAGIRVAVLDTGLDIGHPDFTGRVIVSNTFVGQPVQDLHSHGTHCIGTACGTRSPAGSTPRYGIGYRTSIYVGKVLSNSGSGSTGGILAGINWAIANKCAVISMSLGAQTPVQAAYTAAGNAALQKGCLIVAAAGNAAGSTGAPANSPSIMSVASLDASLGPSSFSNFGKIEIAAPGRDVFSSVPRPTRYGIKSGTSMAAPHVAGCAALWAETNPSLRGAALWRKLQATAKPLPYPTSRVGRGLVQAP